VLKFYTLFLLGNSKLTIKKNFSLSEQPFPFIVGLINMPVSVHTMSKASSTLEQRASKRAALVVMFR